MRRRAFLVNNWCGTLRLAMRPLVVVFMTLTLSAIAGSVSAPASPQPPVLAGPWASNQQGYGHVRPGTIFNGGDDSGLVTNITWSTWGHAEAIGTGLGLYIAPGQYSYEGLREQARVVLFHLGTCHGRPAYDAIEWYYPEHGQHFDPTSYINSCDGAYVEPVRCRVGRYGLLDGEYPAISALTASGLPHKTDGIASPCLVAESIGRAMQATWALEESFPRVVHPRGATWRANPFRCTYSERQGEDPYVYAECRSQQQLVTMDLVS